MSSGRTLGLEQDGTSAAQALWDTRRRRSWSLSNPEPRWVQTRDTREDQARGAGQRMHWVSAAPEQALEQASAWLCVFDFRRGPRFCRSGHGIAAGLHGLDGGRLTLTILLPLRAGQGRHRRLPSPRLFENLLYRVAVDAPAVVEVGGEYIVSLLEVIPLAELWELWWLSEHFHLTQPRQGVLREDLSGIGEPHRVLRGRIRRRHRTQHLAQPLREAGRVPGDGPLVGGRGSGVRRPSTL